MAGAHETANRIHAAGVFVPVPAPPFTSTTLAAKGVLGFVRVQAGQYLVTLMQAIGFHEGFCDATLPANFQGIAGAQLSADGTQALITVLTIDAGIPIDPPFVNFKCWAIREGEGPGPTAGFPPIPPPLPVATSFADEFVPEGAVYPGTTLARPVGRNSHPVTAYPDNADAETFYCGCMDAGWGGLATQVTLYWASTAILGSVEWFLSWERDNGPGGVNLNANSYAAQQSAVSVAAGTTAELAVATIGFSAAQMGGMVAGDPYRLRVRRDGGAGNDNMSGDAQLFRLCLNG